MAERTIDLILNNKYVLWQVVKEAAWLLSGTRRRHKQRRHRISRFNKLQEAADSGARLRGVGGSKPTRNPGRVWASCASASELVVGKINVSLMARVIFHYVQFARELLRPRRGGTRRWTNETMSGQKEFRFRVFSHLTLCRFSSFENGLTFHCNGTRKNG